VGDRYQRIIKLLYWWDTSGYGVKLLILWNKAACVCGRAPLLVFMIKRKILYNRAPFLCDTTGEGVELLSLWYSLAYVIEIEIEYL
jgi:hypothetical protein